VREELVVSDFIGKWTLIVGDVNTGKTMLTTRILETLCAADLSSRIVIIDLAPEISQDLASGKNVKGAGGRLTQPSGTGVVYISSLFEPPRLSSRSEEEAIAKAERNAGKVDGLIEEFNRFNRDILFINDISIAVQAGTAEKLVQQMNSASTLVADGYYGKRLGSGVLSVRERQEMGGLIKHFRVNGRVIIK
jgi:hypothetical protein